VLEAAEAEQEESGRSWHALSLTRRCGVLQRLEAARRLNGEEAEAPELQKNTEKRKEKMQSRR
jgi:hypothetical protein